MELQLLEQLGKFLIDRIINDTLCGSLFVVYFINSALIPTRSGSGYKNQRTVSLIARLRLLGEGFAQRSNRFPPQGSVS